MKKYLLIFLFFLSANANASSFNCNKDAIKKAIADSPSLAVKGAPAGCFDNYTFTYAWLPAWCYSGSQSRSLSPDCLNISKSEGLLSYNLAIHGLWPNYKANSKGISHFPTFCTGSPACDEGDSNCILQASLIDNKVLTEYKLLTPDWLLLHEWQKHGTCTGKKQNAFLKSTIKFYKKLPTPPVIYNNIGKNVTLEELENAYPKKVVIICNKHKGRQLFNQIYTYWSKDGKTMLDRPSGSVSSCDADKPVYITSASDL